MSKNNRGAAGSRDCGGLSKERKCSGREIIYAAAPNKGAGACLTLIGHFDEMAVALWRKPPCMMQAYAFRFFFSQFSLRGIYARNRIVVSPMCQYESRNGGATDWHLVDSRKIRDRWCRHRVYGRNSGGRPRPQNLRMRGDIFGRPRSRLSQNYRFHSQPGRGSGNSTRTCRSAAPRATRRGTTSSRLMKAMRRAG